MKKITKDNQEEVLNQPKAVLKASATWCGPCVSYSKIIAGLKEDLPFYEFDVDDEPELAAKFRIMGIPCTIVLENGVETQRLVGVQTKTTVEGLF